ncbi:FRG domain-containing protein [Vibrio parahaemolyticus]
MWRGQSDIDWRLDSSAYRRLQGSTGYQSADPNKAMIRYEKTLLQLATHRGYRYENGKELSDFELLAKLQHHGAATRLVDFTRNALIGIWFACSENAQKSGLLVAFDTWYLEGYEKELEVRTYEEIVDDFRNDPITWESPGVSARIAAQHSQFMYSKVMQSPSGSLAFPSDERAYRKFELTPELKEEALQVLFEVFDINKSNIFPDMDGFAQANSVSEDISRMHRW